jgi:DNA invertase Pin-like site-specific DNA recombinase
MTKETRKETRAAIYSRVSTANKNQDPETQARELREFVARRGWTLAGGFTDRGVSGAKDRRPALDKMMESARRGDLDVIVCWSLDRLGRSLRHLVLTAEELGTLGVDLACVTQPIDTTSPTGRLTFAVLGAVAEFEREMIRERVRAGVSRAKAQGKRLGRPPLALDLARARTLLDGGASMRAAAKTLGTNARTLTRALSAREVGQFLTGGFGPDEGAAESSARQGSPGPDTNVA